MNRRWLRALVGTVFTLACAMIVPAAQDPPPNIVFLLADDLGGGDLHCYGHPDARTPNIDSLARDGTRFMQFYATGATCCPARTGLMTSKFPATYPAYPANGGFADRVTITELLKRQGVATGHPDIVKKLSAKVDAGVAMLPTEYVKTKNKQD